MSTPKYKTYLELSEAFKRGEVPEGYYIMLDKSGTELRLNFLWDDKLSEKENVTRQEACEDIFNPIERRLFPIEEILNELGIPNQFC